MARVFEATGKFFGEAAPKGGGSLARLFTKIIRYLLFIFFQQVPYSHHTITTATLASTTLPLYFYYFFFQIIFLFIFSYSLATSTSSQVMRFS